MRKFNFKTKLANHLLKDGEKKTSEKVMMQSFKGLQKNSLKNPKKLIKIAVINSAPMFKIQTIKNKKKKKKKRKVIKVPFFITSSNSRMSSAIKLIINSIKEKQFKMHVKLNEEVLAASQKKGVTVQTKNEIQKQVVLNSRNFKLYRW